MVIFSYWYLLYLRLSFSKSYCILSLKGTAYFNLQYCIKEKRKQINKALFQNQEKAQTGTQNAKEYAKKKDEETGELTLRALETQPSYTPVSSSANSERSMIAYIEYTWF